MPIVLVSSNIEVKGSVGAYGPGYPANLATQSAPCLPCACMQLLVAATIITLNGTCATNFGNIQGATSNFPCMRSYPGRLVIKNRNTACEETRFMTAQTLCVGPCMRVRITVSENWDMNPVGGACGDTVEFSYLVNDAGNLCMDVVVCMFSGIATFERTLQIGDACATNPCCANANFGFLYVGCGQTISFEDKCCNTKLTRLSINPEGLLQTGYLVGAQVCKCTASAVSGGGLLTKDCTIETPCPSPQTWINVKNYGTLRAYASSLAVVKDPDSFKVDTGCNSCVDFDCIKMAKYGQNATFLNNTTVRRLNMEGVIGAANQTVELEASSQILSMNMINMAGFVTTGTVPCPCPGQEVINVRCVKFVNTTPKVTVAEDRTWNFINPIWVVNQTNQTDLSFVNCAACVFVNEKYSLKTRALTPAGCIITCTGFYLYEDLRTKLLATDENSVRFEFTGDSTTGFIDEVFTYKNYTPSGACGLTVVTDGCHFLKTYKFGKTPSITAIPSNQKFESVLTLLNDPFTTGSEACGRAPTNIQLRYHGPCGDETNPITFIKFSCGTGCAPTLGTVITEGNPCPATGTFLEFRDGTSTSGTMVIRGRNAVLYSPCDMIASPCCMWTATICCGLNSVLCFTWSLDVCGSPCRTIQSIYNYVSAKIMEGCGVASGICCSSNQRFRRSVEWGRCLQTLPIQPTCVGGCITISTSMVFQCGCPSCGTVPEGVAITRFSSGQIGSFTANCGGTYSPPASATITLTNLEPNSDAYIYKNPSCMNTTPLASASCCVSCSCPCNPGKFRLQYTYCTPFCGCFQIKVFHLCFQPVDQIDCAGTTSKSIRIQQTIDRNYDDPS